MYTLSKAVKQSAPNGCSELKLGSSRWDATNVCVVKHCILFYCLCLLNLKDKELKKNNIILNHIGDIGRENIKFNFPKSFNPDEFFTDNTHDFCLWEGKRYWQAEVLTHGDHRTVNGLFGFQL